METLSARVVSNSSPFLYSSTCSFHPHPTTPLYRVTSLLPNSVALASTYLYFCYLLCLFCCSVPTSLFPPSWLLWHHVPLPLWLLILDHLQGLLFLHCLLHVDAPQDSTPGFLPLGKSPVWPTTRPTLGPATTHADDSPSVYWQAAEQPVPSGSHRSSKLDTWDGIPYLCATNSSDFPRLNEQPQHPTNLDYVFWFLIPLSPSIPSSKSYQVPWGLNLIFYPSSFLKFHICFWLFPFGLTISFYIFACLYSHFSIILGGEELEYMWWVHQV